MKEAENTETSPLNDVRHRKFLVYPGKLIISSNKLKSKFQEEYQGILSRKLVIMVSSNFPERSPSNDICHRKFIVDPGTMINYNDRLKSKFQKKSPIRIEWKLGEDGKFDI